ncbi:synaptogenesis protein syg-2-like isoform X2 [Venturia canescens]|uniref:synaptogenesis protein syg-2-like isoform X2 n=1 Tax=Venturia canescens TaxID=32260 RepID=UPI001C9BEF54|nr:synaptogenesis protein syg-2-like isoform X2 [Venturia canescens]
MSNDEDEDALTSGRQAGHKASGKMRCHPIIVLVTGFLVTVRGQGVPRTFSARPFRGGPPAQVRAVLGGTAELPCDIHPPNRNNDTAILVVWYKNDVVPIYSYDIRGRQPETASRWTDKEYLNERAFFRTAAEPASLNIDHVEERDEGEYRCRVDFTKNPTRNSRINLTVIVPPSKPNIVNELGDTVTKVAGPFEENGSMKLTCLVSGGRPQPNVKWWRGETLIDSKDEPGEFPELKRNTLVVKHLTRADLHAVFTCQASNNNISQPVSAKVAIEMHLKPLSVSILSSELAPLSAGRQYEINCMTVGSRPAAKLSWYMEDTRLTNYTETISEDGNMTTSMLTFNPTLKDNNKVITCRAENDKVHGGFEEDNWKLNVYFMPILTLELGSNMNPHDIEEGDDVYFECKVHANPQAYKVLWKHNGKIIQHNVNNGVIVQPNGLALRGVNRSQAGNYTCVASNVEGDGFSNSVELKIMYKPICLPDQQRIYGVARLEEARIVCKVEAYPMPNNFRWAFNNTEELVDVPVDRYKNSTRHTQSVLKYRPVTEMDYGMVLCWASNTPGTQKTACVFRIIPAGKPEAPYNCTLTNQTTESLSVECTPGFDGGQTQHFVLEVYDQHTNVLQKNLTSRENAAFTVHGLEPGRILNMKLYAVNSKGRSEPTRLEGFTLKIAEKQTVRVLFTGTPVPFEITPLLGILIGVVAALLLVTIIILGALKVRSERRAQRPGDLPVKKATAPSSEDLYDADDRNPDVVPTNKDYQLTGSTAGTPLATQNTPDELPAASLSIQQTNHLQGLANYAHNDYTNYPTLPLTGEVTYAELCLARPTTLTTSADSKLACLGSVGGLAGLGGFTSGLGVLVGGKQYTKEATVYACIDHSARPPKIDQVCQPSSNGGANLETSLLQDSIGIGGKQQQQQQQQQQQHHHHPREVVTVRTPLISTQESCV